MTLLYHTRLFYNYYFSCYGIFKIHEMFEGYMEFLYFGVGIMVLSTALNIKKFIQI